MRDQHIVIGTRGSKLALVQAEYIAATLRHLYPDLEIELRIISTKGDRILDVALSAVGDKGLFVKEIEVALMNGEIDLAVHSGKDLPSVTPDGLKLAAFPKRVNPRDVLILPQPIADTSQPATDAPQPTSLDDIPKGARIGTSSLRRACQLRSLRPDLELLDVRGNVDTRLSKLDSGQYDALVLAAAGLERLGLSNRISYQLPPEVLLPAVAQGALIIETRADDTETLNLLKSLDDMHTRAAVLAERSFLHRLEGGCQVPIAAYAEMGDDDSLYLRGLVGSLDGKTIIRGEKTGSSSDAAILGKTLAEELISKGAEPILAELRTAQA